MIGYSEKYKRAREDAECSYSQTSILRGSRGTRFVVKNPHSIEVSVVQRYPKFWRKVFTALVGRFM